MVRSLCSTFGQWPSPWDWSNPDPPFIATLSLGMVNSCVLLSNNDPLLRNGQVHVLLLDNDPLFGIGQVKILLSSRPSPWDWSSPNPPFITTLSLWMVKSCVLLSDNDPLLRNGWVQVMTLFMRIVIDSYAFSLGLATSFDGSRPSTQ